jgi:hypothetical protein
VTRIKIALLAILLFATHASAEPHPPAAARPDETPRPARLRITARLYGTSEASERSLPSAMREAVKILAKAGVDLAIERCEQWRSGDEENPCAHPLASTDIAVRTYRSSPANGDSAEQRLGYSFIDWSTGRGSLVTIDLSAIEWLAHASRTSARALLARATAHEIGHLLLGTGEHSSEGLMRGLWSAGSLRQKHPGDWRFTSLQIAEIHERRLPQRSTVAFASSPLLARVVKSTD